MSLTALICSALALPILCGAPAAPMDGPSYAPASWPSPARVQRATRLARTAQSDTDLAVIDSSGHLGGGPQVGQTHASASLSKAMLMIDLAEQARDRPLTSFERARSEPMIVYSDNDAANSIYYHLGSDAALERIAHHVGMQDLDACGSWACAGLSARDQAQLFWQLDQAVRGRHRMWALDALKSISPAQRWGIARVVDDQRNTRGGRLSHLQIWHKSGWRPDPGGWRFNQAARVCRVRPWPADAAKRFAELLFRLRSIPAARTTQQYRRQIQLAMQPRQCMSVAVLTQNASSEGAAHDLHERIMSALVS